MEGIKNSLELYITKGYKPGGFLTSVLENDLTGAVGRADHINIKRLPDIVKYIYNNIPSNVWGSRAIVEKHLKSFNK